MKHLSFLILFFLFFSCKESSKEQITRLVKEWEGKEILFPKGMVFTKFGVDTLGYQMPETEWKIITYIDSVGCTSCKLKFHQWTQIKDEMKSIAGVDISFLFVFHPKQRDLAELNYLMKRDSFSHPVWIDGKDEFNKMNKLPDDSRFHSLLVDKQNKVVAIGSPFQNPQIRELYMKLICGNVVQKVRPVVSTIASLSQSVVDLGEFEWLSAPQKATFTLKNDGENRLVINEIVSSCGCISVDYSREPVDPGKDISVNVTYKAEEPEHVNKSLIIYANIKSPLKLTIKGNAY